MRLPWGVISILFRFHGVCRADEDPPALSPRAALIAYGKRITETLRKGGSLSQIDVKSMNEVNGCAPPRPRLSAERGRVLLYEL